MYQKQNFILKKSCSDLKGLAVILQAKRKTRSKKLNIFLKTISLSKEPSNPMHNQAWFPPNNVAQNSTTKDVPSIKIITSGRKQVKKSRTYHSLHDKNFIFFFYYILH